MATVIDSLVVQLTLDPTRYKAGEAEVAKSLKRTADTARSAAEDIKASGEGAAEFFGSLRNQAIALFAVFLGGRGLKDFAGQTMAAAAATGYLSRAIGVSTKEISAWEGAVKQFGGGTAQEASAAIQTLAMEFEKLKMGGQSSLTPFFNYLHVGMTKAGGGIKSMTEMLIDASTALSKMDPAKANFLMAQYGGLPAGMRNLLLQGPTAVRSALAEQEARGTTTQQQAEAFIKLQSAMTGLQLAAESAARDGLEKIAPAVTRALKEMDEQITLFRAGKGDLFEFFKLLKEINDWSLDNFLRNTVRPAADKLLKEGIKDPYEGDTILENARKNFNRAMRMLGTPSLQIPASTPGPPSSSGGGGGSGLPAYGTPANAVMEETRAFWKSKGLPDDEVAAILANVAAESSFVPNRQGDKDASGAFTSYGLYQHHLARRDAMFAKYGPNPTVQQQNEVAYQEYLNNPGLRAAMRMANGVGPKTKVFTKIFENPKNADAVGDERAKSGHLFETASRPGPTLPPIDPALMGAGLLGGSSSNTNIHSDTRVGQITINTQAREPAAVAQEVAKALGSTSPSVANTAYGPR